MVNISFNKSFNCKLCERPINHQGNCMACNIKNMKKSQNVKLGLHDENEPKTEQKDETKSVEYNSLEEFTKAILDDNYWGDRLWLRKKQRYDKCFKESIYKKNKSQCFFCKKTSNLNIHHLSYEILCPISRVKRRATRKTKRYTCSACQKNKPLIFDKCTDNTMLLCFPCHKKLHTVMKETFGYWVPPKERYN